MPVLSLVALLVYAGFCSLYASSIRTMPGDIPVFGTLLAPHRTLAQVTGWGLILLALAIAIGTEGPGVGVFSFFIILMTLGSLIVLLAPLKILNYPGLYTIFALMALSEIYFF